MDETNHSEVSVNGVFFGVENLADGNFRETFKPKGLAVFLALPKNRRFARLGWFAFLRTRGPLALLILLAVLSQPCGTFWSRSAGLEKRSGRWRFKLGRFGKDCNVKRRCGLGWRFRLPARR